MSDRPAAPPRRSPRLVATADRVQTRVNEALSNRARRRGCTTAALGYPGYAAQGRTRVHGRLVLAPAGADPSARVSVPCGRRLLSLEQPNEKIDVCLGHSRVRARADEAGLTDLTIPLELPPGRIRALLHVECRPPVLVPVHVAFPDATRGVVCDIDDMVWTTGIRHPLPAPWRTFAGNGSTHRPVNGIAALLSCLVEESRNAPVIYLSNGPRNLTGRITNFLDRHGFPAGALLVTDWGFSPRALFRSGKAHKRWSLERLAEELPGVDWVMIGDDGEHDPEIYPDFARAHPQQVAALVLPSVAPIGTARPETQEMIGAIPVFRAGDGAALAERLVRSGPLPGHRTKDPAASEWCGHRGRR